MRLIAGLLAALLLVGCQTMWFKQGATDADLKIALTQCRLMKMDVAPCMHERGWIVEGSRNLVQFLGDH